MARLNIEEPWWTDTRRFALIERIGSEFAADGLMLHVWHMAQRFWGNGKRKIPFFEFKKFQNYQDLLDLDLARKDGELIYVRGTRLYHDWYLVRKLSSAKGGISKANRVKQTASNDGSKRLATTVVSSSSSSSSSKKEEEGVERTAKQSLPRLAEIWNDCCGQLSRVKTTSPGRKRKAELLWRRIPDEEHWESVVRRIALSPFCNGTNDRGWRATFDFLIKPDTEAKTLEGLYDSKQIIPVDLYVPEREDIV